MTLQILGHSFGYGMECIARLFYPGEKITVTQEAEARDEALLRTEVRREEGILLSVAVKLDGRALTAEERYQPAPEDDIPRETQRRLGVLLFRVLCEATGTRPPWGALTGVRPVRLLGKLTARCGLTPEQARDRLVRDYHVLPQKAALALDVFRAQERIPGPDTGGSYSLYVSIPFCPTRCLYCSFVSHAVDRAEKLLPDYLSLLGKELLGLGRLAGELGLTLRTIYIGGGTPTVLEPFQLRGLLSRIKEAFPVSSALEYTVEAGRPDSISREKLEVLKDFGVSRISVNPQTMDDAILEAIGRNHTARQTEEAYHLAKEMGFDRINMDLIAGLPGQSPDSFAQTLEQVMELHPCNITVHTLTVKRSSALRARPDAYERSPYPLGEMLSHAQGRLGEAGYRPYYLYRQQGTRQNHENVGYSLPGREGLYNVYSMEDTQTILAAGAGGVTKLCASGGRMKRLFNYKYPFEYVADFASVMARKREVADFFSRQADSRPRP